MWNNDILYELWDLTLQVCTEHWPTMIAEFCSYRETPCSQTDTRRRHIYGDSMASRGKNVWNDFHDCWTNVNAMLKTFFHLLARQCIGTSRSWHVTPQFINPSMWSAYRPGLNPVDYCTGRDTGVCMSQSTGRDGNKLCQVLLRNGLNASIVWLKDDVIDQKRKTGSSSLSLLINRIIHHTILHGIQPISQQHLTQLVPIPDQYFEACINDGDGHCYSSCKVTSLKFKLTYNTITTGCFQNRPFLTETL